MPSDRACAGCGALLDPLYVSTAVEGRWYCSRRCARLAGVLPGGPRPDVPRRGDLGLDRNDPGVWVAAGGRLVAVRDMDDGHLLGAIALLRRRWRERVDALLAAGHVGSARLAYRAGPGAGTGGKYEALLAEADRRGAVLPQQAGPDVPGEAAPPSGEAPRRALRWKPKTSEEG